MVCSQYPPIYGGAGAQAALLAETLAQREWRVGVVTLDQQGLGSDRGGRVEVTRVLSGVSPTDVRSRAVSTAALSLAAAIRILVTRAKVVHVHGIYWWTIIPALVGRLIGATVIIKSTRDGEDDVATVVTKKFGQLPLGWIYGLSLKAAHAIVVLNDSSLRKAEDAGYGKKTFLMRNGVDETKFRAGPSHSDCREGPQPVFLFVGYLAAHKGVGDLLEAWSTLGSSGSAQLRLVGPFRGFYRELDDEIARRAEELSNDPASGVKMLGQLAQDDLIKEYQNADYFVFPSYVEGMPNSLLEARVCGCTVIATAIPGILDVVARDEFISFEPGDIPRLREILQSAITGGLDPVMPYQGGYGITEVAGAYEDLYRLRSERQRP